VTLLSGTAAKELQSTKTHMGRLQTKTGPHYKDPVKMQALYDRYPQLTSGNTNNCVRHFNTMLMNLTYFPYELMTMYGSMQLNDLGSYTECKRLPDSDYAVISLNFSHSPLTLFFGACMPQECIQSDYWAVTKATTDLITGLYRSIIGNATPTEGTFRSWTEISVTVRKTDEIV
jgi:hypothetical protein